MEINIAKEYTTSPGPRHIDQGEFSGEHFRETLLKPRFSKALEQGEKLIINLDGGYGYPTSFLDEAFGGLARQLSSEVVLKNIELISDEEPSLISEITNYSTNCNKRSN